jgi:hypothetical protein
MLRVAMASDAARHGGYVWGFLSEVDAGEYLAKPSECRLKPDQEFGCRILTGSKTDPVWFHISNLVKCRCNRRSCQTIEIDRHNHRSCPSADMDAPPIPGRVTGSVVIQI